MSVRFNRWGWLLALSGIACAWADAEAPSAPEYDAAFVRLEVPEGVTAQEVFPVTIIMRNTGTRTWEGWPIRLRSVHPPNNRLWGTEYILIAQGTAVRAGEEYAFRSQLRAPADPGPAKFQWQVCKDGEDWFGEVTPPRTIDVVARPAAPSPADAPRSTTSTAKKVLNFADFEYLGSFKPPKIVRDARGAFSESGLALRPMPDGRDRLFVNYTHPTQVLFELEIPELTKIREGRHTDLKTAEVQQVWGSLKLPVDGQQDHVYQAD